MGKLGHLPRGQSAIIKSFQRHGLDSVYVPSDIMDLRVCSAMREKGLLARYEEGGLAGYELTDIARQALTGEPG